MFKREIPCINLKHFVNKLVCLMRIFSAMYRIMLTLALILVLSGSVRCVAGGIFPSSFYFRSVTPTEIPQENSVDSEIGDSDPVGAISEADFTALRIEYIKNQILKKLRLKEKPQITIADLPKPIKENENLLPNQDTNFFSRYDDDFYGKTTQAVVLPYEGINNTLYLNWLFIKIITSFATFKPTALYLQIYIRKNATTCFIQPHSDLN